MSENGTQSAIDHAALSDESLEQVTGGSGLPTGKRTFEPIQVVAPKAGNPNEAPQQVRAVGELLENQ